MSEISREMAVRTINKECENTFLLVNCSDEFAEALAKAISDMEKLEKIEQIVFEYDCSRPPSDCYECMDEKLEAIEQIVKG